MAAAIVFAALTYLIVHWKADDQSTDSFIVGLVALTTIVCWFLSLLLALLPQV